MRVDTSSCGNAIRDPETGNRRPYWARIRATKSGVQGVF